MAASGRSRGGAFWLDQGKVALSLLVAVLVWWAVAASGFVSPDLFPTPGAVWTAAVELYDDGLLFSDFLASLRRAAVGFFIGATLGVATGLLTSRTRFFRLALNPILSLCRPIPAIAIVPVAIVWFFQVVIPAAAPHIVSGLRLGAALAFLSLVAAELTGASSGIGYRLQEARQYLRMDRMFVGLIELGILGAVLDFAFLSLSRHLVHWEQT